ESEGELADGMERGDEIAFDAVSASLRARRLRRLGAIALAEQPLTVVADDAAARMLAQGVARLGIERLPWTKPLRQWRDRVTFLRRAEGGEWPDLSDAALAATAVDWLAPPLAGKAALRGIASDDFAQALPGVLPWPLSRRRGPR